MPNKLVQLTWAKQKLEVPESPRICSPFHLSHVHECHANHAAIYVKNCSSIPDSPPSLTIQKFLDMTSKICLPLWLPPRLSRHNVEAMAFNQVPQLYFDHPTESVLHRAVMVLLINVDQSKSFPCLKPSSGFPLTWKIQIPCHGLQGPSGLSDFSSNHFPT